MARSKGFSIVEVLIVVVVLIVAGFIGWKVWDSMNTPKASEQTSQQPTAADDSIKSDKDLEAVDKTLDSTDIEGSELDQLDTETNF